jgi:hypothetical protein
MSDVCGSGDGHCCWFNGVPCQHLSPSQRAAYKWQCDLKVKYSTWEEVHESPEYIADVQQKMRDLGYEIDCGSFPPKGVACHDCGNGVK